jgi:hypothetical protein
VRNKRGQVVYVEPSEPEFYDLTPVAFELYRLAEWWRERGLGDMSPARPLSADAYDFFVRNLNPADSPISGLISDFSPWNAALRLETAAEEADWLGI